MEDRDRNNGHKVVTTSRIRAWWLQTTKGYKLDTTKRVPNENAFGELYYKAHYHLSKREED